MIKTVDIPDSLDTNLTYEAYYDAAKDQWVIFPVSLRTFEEFLPI